MSPTLWAVVVISGAVGQFLDSLAGMGFGALSSTIMLSGGVSPVMAVGAINTAKVGSGLVSGLSHWHLGNVQWRWVLPMLFFGMIGGILAVFILTSIPAQVLRVIVPSMLVVMGILVLYRFLLARTVLIPIAGGIGEHETVLPNASVPIHRSTQKMAGAVAWFGAIGFLGGVFNGLSGSFGPFTTSALLLKQRGHPRFAIGTVNVVEFFIAATVSAALIFRIPASDWHWGLPLALVIGSVLTAPLGAYFCRHLPSNVVGIVVGCTLIALNAWTLVGSFAY
jgi:hypothetical protein